MTGENDFAHFLERLRAGDHGAAEELVRRYESVIRREVRMRLTDPRLYRQFDSADVCQSVLRSFFVRVAAGQYDLDRPRDLQNLLVVMACNKFVSRSRQARRPGRAAAPLVDEVPDRRPSAEQAVEYRDLLEQVRRRLSEEESQLADLRAEGCSWPEVAARAGGTPEARRKQLARALSRVLHHLGLDDEA